MTKVKESAKKYERTETGPFEEAYELEDLVEEIGAVMENQESENPNIKQIHARLSPEWKVASEKVAKWLMSNDEGEIDRLREEIISDGEIGMRVLMDLLLSIKNQKQP